MKSTDSTGKKMASLKAMFEKTGSASMKKDDFAAMKEQPQVVKETPVRKETPRVATPSTSASPKSSPAFARLLNKFNTNSLLDENEAPAMPRRQSIGGVSVKDLASSHEKSRVLETAKKAKATQRVKGSVKPVVMQEISIPTIDEDKEYEETERASEVIKKTREEGEKKGELDDWMQRDSIAAMFDDICKDFDSLDLDTLQEEAAQVPAFAPAKPAPAVKPAPATKPVAKPTPSPAPAKTTPQTTPQAKEASSTAKKTPPPVPTQAPPAKPQLVSLEGMGVIDDVQLEDLTDDLDFDTIVAEMSKNVMEQLEKGEEEKRQSRQSLGYSFSVSGGRRWRE